MFVIVSVCFDWCLLVVRVCCFVWLVGDFCWLLVVSRILVLLWLTLLDVLLLWVWLLFVYWLIDLGAFWPFWFWLILVLCIYLGLTDCIWVVGYFALFGVCFRCLLRYLLCVSVNWFYWCLGVVGFGSCLWVYFNLVLWGWFYSVACFLLICYYLLNALVFAAVLCFWVDVVLLVGGLFYGRFWFGDWLFVFGLVWLCLGLLLT